MSVERWLGRVAPETAERYLIIFRGWLRWMEEHGDDLAKLGPDGLVEFQRGHRGYEILDLVQRYVSGLDWRVSSKQTVYGTLRSFFMHNRVPLPQDRSFRIKSDRPKTVGSLTIADLRRMLDSCNECHRAVFLCMFQAGMGLNELAYWNVSGLKSLREQLSRGTYPIRIDLPGRKQGRNSRPFYTFIGRDAIDALKVWLRVRPESEAIFVNQYGKPLTKRGAWMYWTRHLQRLSLINRRSGSPGNRYGKNPHELRDLFRSRWQKSRADSTAAEFFLGHIIDPNDYNKAFRDQAYAEEEYLRAEPWLNIVSEDPEHVPVRDYRRLEQRLQEERRELRGELQHLRELIEELRVERS